MFTAKDICSGSIGCDALAALCWLGATSLLALAAWRLSTWLDPRAPLRRRLISSYLLAWAGIVLTAFVLGTAGLLRADLWLVVISALSVSILGLLQRRFRRQTASPSTEDGLNKPPPALADLLWLLVWGLVAAFWIGHVVWNGLLTFPADWDTLAYHLPLVDQWLQARSLYAPDCVHWGNPGNNELLTLWLVAPFSGDFLFAVTNLPAAVLLACAAFDLTCLLGLSRAFAHLSALAIVSNYVVLRQLVNVENDVTTAALFLTCLSYGFRYAGRTLCRPHRRRCQPWLAGRGQVLRPGLCRRGGREHRRHAGSVPRLAGVTAGQRRRGAGAAGGELLVRPQHGGRREPPLSLGQHLTG
jgi:hypothetical protein